MPYIPEADRDAIFKGEKKIEKKGELTYAVFQLALDFIGAQGINYQNISDACAALHDAELEIRRRVLNPYEDEKIKQNGDIL